MSKNTPSLQNISRQTDVLLKNKSLKMLSMEDKLVRVNTYERLEEAMLDQQILTENDISSNIYNSAMANILPIMYEINEGIALLVFEKEADKARDILREYHLATDVTP